jgi:spore coat polysaccharide biosynthesis predicted glycosyltransferase SpsG
LELGCSPFLFSHHLPDSLRRRASDLGISIRNRKSFQSEFEICREVIREKPDCVVFDGYEFDSSSVRTIYQSGIPTVVIDDLGEHNHSPAHLRVNQNLYANELVYADCMETGQLLLGPEYAMIGFEIVKRRSMNTTRSLQQIFITMGGGDSRGLARELRDLCVEQSAWNVTYTGNQLLGNGLSPFEMAHMMSIAGIGIIACGTTVLEAMCLGMPFVGLVIADNQELVGRALDESCGYPIIDFRSSQVLETAVSHAQVLLSDEIRRTRLKNLGMDLVDGKGIHRVASKILDLIS